MRAVLILAAAAALSEAAFLAQPPMLGVRSCTARAAMAPALPTSPRRRSRLLATPIAASAAASLRDHDHGHNHNRRSVARATSLVALAVAIRRWLVAAWRSVVGGVRGILTGGVLATGTASNSPPTLTLVHSGARSISNLLVTEGVATRSVPAPDPVLAYFNYRFSPFYAALPATDVLSASPPSPAASAEGQVRWLTHRYERPPTEGERLLDSARRNLLQQLYDEACAEERRASSPGAWFDSLFGGSA